MNNRFLRALSAGAFLTSLATAQPGAQRQASMIGGGDPNRGKCTIEVVVDDVAQVEVRGTSAVLRTMSGQPAQWRRFECTGPLPSNAPDFRFAGVDGRGRQSLIRDPRNGGVAVVQIEDRDGGSEGYTFDLFWGGGGGGYQQGGDRGSYQQGPPPNQPGYDDRERGQYRPNYRDSDYYRRYRHGFNAQEAVRICESTILQRAQRRFRGDIHFHRTALDDGPGRADWVVGMIDVHRRDGHEDRFRFSCSVDFESGRVRSADIDPSPVPDDPRWRQ